MEFSSVGFGTICQFPHSYEVMVLKCGSMLTTHENHEKGAKGLAIKISPTASQCQATRE